MFTMLGMVKGKIRGAGKDRGNGCIAGRPEGPVGADPSEKAFYVIAQTQHWPDGIETISLGVHIHVPAKHIIGFGSEASHIPKALF